MTIIEPNTSPAFWWVNPWGYALGLKRALHAVHALSEEHASELRQAYIDMSRLDAKLDMLNGKEIEQIKSDHNAFQRKVEVALEGVITNPYEHTIDLVFDAVDEIKRLRASLSVMTEDRDAYIEKLDRERGTHEATLGYVRQLEEKVNHLEAKWPRDLWNGGKIYGDVYTCQPNSKTHNETAKAKRKVLAEDKTTGKKLLAPKKKAKYGDARDGYSAIGRRYLKHLALVQARRKAIAKAKKKGGRR